MSEKPERKVRRKLDMQLGRGAAPVNVVESSEQDEDAMVTSPETEGLPSPVEIKSLIDTLREGYQKSKGNFSAAERPVLRRAAHQLAELCKQEECIDAIVAEGAIEAVVPYLTAAGTDRILDFDAGAQEELEKEACFIVGLLAVKPEYQSRIAECGALPGLVRLLKEHRLTSTTKCVPGSGGVARRAADAVTNLAHENVEIKNTVREVGGVPPLVSLLEAMDHKVQRAAAGALRTLAFKNEDNKNQIVECGALPVLVQMLRSEEPGVHYEAVGVIGNLVHSSAPIKRRVLEEGAMQPVINLLSSPCPESMREAALLLGQFATTDADTKARIVQRGAVPPLIHMLAASDIQIKEMAAFALGRLAQNGDNQAGIVQCGGLGPLLELLESKHYNLQHNAAFALYGLADNEDNVPGIVREGALQRLHDCGERLQVQASKDCVQKTISRMESKLGQPNRTPLHHVVFMLRSNDKVVQQRAALALARLAPEAQVKSIFVDKRGLDVLLDMLQESGHDSKMRRDAAAALLDLERKLSSSAPASDCAPAQPCKTVYLGSQYVNSPMLSDITFVVDGHKFYAHRIALLASSDAFRAMFNGGYREKEASSIDIPNIPWSVFEAMMRYIYTGQVDITPDIATELLQASDQYLLEGLKRLCEDSIAGSLSVDNCMDTYELSEAYGAPQLGKRSVLFAFEHFEEVLGAVDACAYTEVMRRMVTTLRQAMMQQ